MYEYVIEDIANLELRDVEMVYLTYFARLGDAAKGAEWAERFYREYREKINDLKKDPFRYPICTVYPFNCIDAEYRSFTVGWFTIFYTIEAKRFIVWHVRSSKSDFSSMAD